PCSKYFSISFFVLLTSFCSSSSKASSFNNFVAHAGILFDFTDGINEGFSSDFLSNSKIESVFSSFFTFSLVEDNSLNGELLSTSIVGKLKLSSLNVVFNFFSSAFLAATFFDGLTSSFTDLTISLAEPWPSFLLFFKVSTTSAALKGSTFSICLTLLITSASALISSSIKRCDSLGSFKIDVNFDSQLLDLLYFFNNASTSPFKASKSFCTLVASSNIVKFFR